MQGSYFFSPKVLVEFLFSPALHIITTNKNVQKGVTELFEYWSQYLPQLHQNNSSYETVTNL